MRPNPSFATRTCRYGEAAIGEAAVLIGDCQVVAMPTETVYGLAADATRQDAVARIFEAKGRPSFNPLIVHVAAMSEAETLGLFDGHAHALAAAHWPGPLTLVVPARNGNGIATAATAGLPTIAIRVPAHRAMRALLEATRRPLAAPSANRSGGISPTRAAHVVASLGGRIPLIIDDGDCPAGLESTIIACTGGGPRLLRPGPIDSGITNSDTKGIEAPGQLASHYAPTKPLRLNAKEARPGEWLIGFGTIVGNSNLSPTGDVSEAARHLFAALHEADRQDVPNIAIARIPDHGIGSAINDRLQRAAHE